MQSMLLCFPVSHDSHNSRDFGATLSKSRDETSHGKAEMGPLTPGQYRDSRDWSRQQGRHRTAQDGTGRHRLEKDHRLDRVDSTESTRPWRDDSVHSVQRVLHKSLLSASLGISRHLSASLGSARAVAVLLLFFHLFFILTFAKSLGLSKANVVS